MSASSISVVIPSNKATIPISIAATVSENIAQWGGTAVTAPPATGIPAVGTEVAPVVKPLQRRLTTTEFASGALGASATFTGAWHDTNQTGACFAEIMAFPSNAVGVGSMNIDISDDQTEIQTITKTPTLTTVNNLGYSINKRYWRGRYGDG